MVHDIVKKISDYFKEQGYQLKERENLLNPLFPDTFYPSALHTYVYDLINQKKSLKKEELYFVVQPCFRHVDLPTIGYSRNHLSLFEMVASSYACDISKYLKEEDKIKEKIITQAWHILTKVLSISKSKIAVTVFGGMKMDGKILEKDEKSFKCWKSLGVNQVVYVPGTENFFYLQKPGQAAGPRCEIYVEIIQNQWLEIASTIFEIYRVSKKFHLVEPKNCVCGIALGVERLSVAIGGFQSIFEIDSVKSLIEILHKELRESIMLHLFNEKILNIVDHVRAITFIITDLLRIKNSQLETKDLLTKAQSERLNKVLKQIISNLVIIGVKEPFKLLENLIQKCIEIYSPRYLELKDKQAEIISFILKYFKKYESIRIQ